MESQPQNPENFHPYTSAVIQLFIYLKIWISFINVCPGISVISMMSTNAVRWRVEMTFLYRFLQ